MNLPYNTNVAYVPVEAKRISVVANGAITANCPAAYYYDANGVLTATPVAPDSNSIRWGIAESAIADTATGILKIGGSATLPTGAGGTSGQLVTAITASGGMTVAAVASTNADINVLGMCTASNTMVIW